MFYNFSDTSCAAVAFLIQIMKATHNNDLLISMLIPTYCEIRQISTPNLLRNPVTNVRCGVFFESLLFDDCRCLTILKANILAISNDTHK